MTHEPTRAERVDDLVCDVLAVQAIAHARGKQIARKTIERYVAEIIRYCDETHVPPVQGIGTNLTTNAGILRFIRRDQPSTGSADPETGGS